MSTDFEFNAPQFINFREMDDPRADQFFDVNLQQQDTNHKILNSSTRTEFKKVKTENKDPSLNTEKSCKQNYPVLRKVLNEIVNQQIQTDKNVQPQPEKIEGNLLQNLKELKLDEEIVPTSTFLSTKKVQTAKKDKNKSKISSSSSDINNQKLNLPMESPNTLDCQKEFFTAENYVSSTQSGKLKRRGSPINPCKKFISLAEQIEHFYKDTPDRFRSKPHKQTETTSSLRGAKPNCLPKTPNLSTKLRSRKTNFPDRQQREEMELEEMKRHQIKAHPLNEKILKSPCLNLKVPIIKKPVTVPQPFSLTEVKKKECVREPVFHFKAQPLPATIFHGPVGIPPKRVASSTVPVTPHIRVPMRLRVEVKSPDVNSSTGSLNLPQKTKIEPFSFDSKIKEMFQKKEEFVKKIIEDEKKNFNSFKAQPMPSFATKIDQNVKSEKSLHKTTPRPFNLTQPRMNKTFSQELVGNSQERLTPFKAKPALVIHQKPFVPKLDKHETLIPSDFQLNTEKRAVERQKFDEKIKKKEEEYALILKQHQEEEEKKEREKILEERKKAEFKARPVPRYKAFEIHDGDPGKLTYPQSPFFSSKMREGKKGN